MFRKIASLSVALVVAGGVMIAVPADAAVKISNGVACKKSGQTTKTSGGTYRCAKNPLVSSKKLTWLSLECLETANLYVSTRKMLPTVKKNSDARIAEIDVDLKKAQADYADLLANGPAKIALIQPKLDDAKAKLAKLRSDTANVTKNAEAIKQWGIAIKGWEDAIDDLGAAGKTKLEKAINRMVIFKNSAIGQYTSADASVKDALQMAKLICTKGF
jgi:hypothetical protein